MSYGHAERNLGLIRQVEAETRQLPGRLRHPDPEQSAWLQEFSYPGGQPVNYTEADRAKGQVALKTVESFHAHRAPPIAEVVID